VRLTPKEEHSSSELRNVNEVDDFSDFNDSIELTDFSAT